MELTDLPTSPDSPDIPLVKNNQPWDCTTTGVEMVEKQSQLPTENNRQLNMRCAFLACRQKFVATTKAIR